MAPDYLRVVSRSQTVMLAYYSNTTVGIHSLKLVSRSQTVMLAVTVWTTAVERFVLGSPEVGWVISASGTAKSMQNGTRLLEGSLAKPDCYARVLFQHNCWNTLPQVSLAKPDCYARSNSLDNCR